jgi:hypothetical protein
MLDHKPETQNKTQLKLKSKIFNETMTNEMP